MLGSPKCLAEETFVLNPELISRNSTSKSEYQGENFSSIDHVSGVLNTLANHVAVIELTRILLSPAIEAV